MNSYRVGFSVGMELKKKHGGGQVVFESDREIILPTNKEGAYVLERDGVKYAGLPAKKSIIASFTMPFQSERFFGLEYSVILQFMRKTVFVKFESADLKQVWRFLESTFKSRFRLKNFFLRHDLLRTYGNWSWNMDFFVYQFKHNPKKVVSLGKARLQRLMTIISLRELPQDFNQRTEFIQLQPANGDIFNNT